MDRPPQADRNRGGDPSLHHHHEQPLIRIRRRRRRSFLRTGILNPFEEIVRSLLTLARRHPIPIVLLSSLALWWFWPTLRSSPDAVGVTNGSVPRVITVFVEDPQRTIAAFELRKNQPGSVLILQGRPTSQSENQAYLEHQGKWPADMSGVLRMTQGCDTVGQLTALTRWADTLPEAGILTVVTSPAHMDRSLAIARILLEGRGWTVLGADVETGDNRPESRWRLIRDQLRAQLWRVTGWDGTDELHCQRVEEAARQGGAVGDSF